MRFIIIVIIIIVGMRGPKYMLGLGPYPKRLSGLRIDQ